MPGFSNGVLSATNVDFRSVQPVVGQVVADGQLLIGSTASPNIRVSTLTAGTGIEITNAAGSITISGMLWSTVGAGTPLLVNRGFICTSGASLSFSLPAVSSVGDKVGIALDGSTSWTISQGAGQQIRLGNRQTTLGVGGSLSSTVQGDKVELVCVTANQKWICLSSMGNIIII